MRLLSCLLGVCIFLLDLGTKWWVHNTEWLQYYSVIDGFFSIQYTENEGIAFGLFHTLQSDWKPLILTAMAAVALFIVFYSIWSAPTEQRLPFFSMGLLLGGISGNLVDRLLHHHVVDFLHLHWGNYFAWPTFNLADAAITCGVLLILFETFFRQGEGVPQESEAPRRGNK